jgi:hypothetical protein
VEFPAGRRTDLQTGDGDAGESTHSLQVDASFPAKLTFLRLGLVLVLGALGLVAVPAAQADDLIQLSGDTPVTLGGSPSFGLLYLDGVVRLAADTSITATDVFIGPDAQLQTCDVGGNANGCTNGRSLAITASGGVAISPAIDLRGGVGTNRAGGSLSIRAARVSLGGGIETAGTLALSGGVAIVSPGLVVTQNIHAPGAAITVHGAGGVSIGGDVSNAGVDPSASGAVVDLASSAGDVNVLGAISSAGRDMVGAGAVQGGAGGDVRVSGGEIRISGGIDSSSGRGVDASAGVPGGIALAARGSIIVSGPVNASGDVSTSGYGSDGAGISMTAAGSVFAGSVSSQGGGSTNLYSGAGGSVALTAGAVASAGAINTAGAGSPQVGRHGGAVTVTAGSVAIGAVTTDAGDATLDPANGSGEAGGPVAIKATAAVGVGAVSAHGGSGRVLGGGGPGGAVSISGDRVTTGPIAALGENLSAPGGSVTLLSQTALLVGGSIDTSGAAGANGGAGGAGGPMLLSTHGPLTLGGRLRSEGGAGSSGGPAGAPGGNGGAIELVVQSIASSTGVLSGGGTGGNAGVQNGPQGRGGDGGRVRVWAQLPSLILLQLVDSTGGQGVPNGADGPQQDEAAPTGLSITKTQTLAFTPNAPDAEGYRVFASVAGAPAKLLLTTKTSGVALPKVAACVQTDYTLAGFHSGVGWQSDPVGPVGYMAPPSDTQACTDAPQVTLGVSKLKKKLNPLRKKKWRVPIRFLADGMGTVHVALSRGKKELAFVDKPLSAVRRNVTVTLTIPKKPKNLRKAGKFTVTVTGSAPIGKARSKSTLTLEVKK